MRKAVPGVTGTRKSDTSSMLSFFCLHASFLLSDWPPSLGYRQCSKQTAGSHLQQTVEASCPCVRDDLDHSCQAGRMYKGMAAPIQPHG